MFRVGFDGFEVQPRIVGLGCGVPLEEVGDAVVHLAASDGHGSVCTVPAVVDVQSVAFNKFSGINRRGLAIQTHEPLLHCRIPIPFRTFTDV